MTYGRRRESFGVLDRLSYQFPDGAAGGRVPGTETPVDLLPTVQAGGFAGSALPLEAHAPVLINRSQIDALIAAVWGRCKFFTAPINVGTAPVLLRPNESRFYVFLLNTDAVNNLIVSFGRAPSSVTDGVRLFPNAFYEPLKIPQNEIWVLGSAAGVTGTLIVSAEI